MRQRKDRHRDTKKFIEINFIDDFITDQLFYDYPSCFNVYQNNFDHQRI